MRMAVQLSVAETQKHLSRRLHEGNLIPVTFSSQTTQRRAISQSKCCVYRTGGEGRVVCAPIRVGNTSSNLLYLES
jgi:hypothetical protein